MELTTRDEKSLLLYFETQATDYGGTLESVRMNADDFALAKRWREAGFIQFGRIAFNDIKRHSGVARDHWVVLSEEAWKLAHAERRARCERVMATLKVERNGLEARRPREAQRRGNRDATARKRMTTTDPTNTTSGHAVAAPVVRDVGRPAPERADGSEHYWDDLREDFSDEPKCPCCGGDGMDPMTDYALPCPECGGDYLP